MATATIPAIEIFRSELREAHRLGFTLKLLMSEPGLVAARLEPFSASALSVCSRQDAAFIQAACAVENEQDRLDVARETIRTALGLAKDALA